MPANALFVYIALYSFFLKAFFNLNFIIQTQKLQDGNRTIPLFFVSYFFEK